jgi:prepilin-type N-terminal cleavage/methylation domain-containing protein
MFSTIKRILKGEKGFTLIELLVVVAIIGILVAIAIPQFAAYKKNANDSAAETDIRNMALASEAYYAGNNAYPGTGGTAAVLTAITLPCADAGTTVDGALCTSGFAKLSKNNTITFTPSATTPQTYLITGANSGGSKTYTWNSASGGLQ